MAPKRRKPEEEVNQSEPFIPRHRRITFVHVDASFVKPTRTAPTVATRRVNVIKTDLLDLGGNPFGFAGHGDSRESLLNRAHPSMTSMRPTAATSTVAP